MTYQHKDLASGRWEKLTLVQQMAHIGSEVERAISWRKKENKEYSTLAFYRALELIDLTVRLSLPASARRELSRVRAALVDDFAGKNIFHSTDIAWQRYFSAFTWAARIASRGEPSP